MIQMIVKAENVEVRGCERKAGRAGEYLLIHVDDFRGRRSDLVDKDLENEKYYARGTVGTFWLSLDIGKYSTVTVSRFQVSEGKP